MGLIEKVIFDILKSVTVFFEIMKDFKKLRDQNILFGRMPYDLFKIAFECRTAVAELFQKLHHLKVFVTLFDCLQYLYKLFFNGFAVFFHLYQLLIDKIELLLGAVYGIKRSKIDLLSRHIVL